MIFKKARVICICNAIVSGELVDEIFRVFKNSLGICLCIKM